MFKDKFVVVEKSAFAFRERVAFAFKFVEFVFVVVCNVFDVFVDSMNL